MKRDSTYIQLVLAVATIAICLANPRSRADEPAGWCRTHDKWVAKVGNHRAVASVSCPTYGDGTCDTPSVRDFWIPTASTPVVAIRIKFHVFCEDDGSNCAVSIQDVADAMTQLNSDYAPYRIQFIESESAEFIADSRYRYYAWQSEEEAMKNTYADDPAQQLNVYVVHVNDFAFCGYGTYPFDPDALGNQGGILMHKDCFG